MRSKLFPVLVLAVLVGALCCSAQLVVTPDLDGGVYEVRQIVHWHMDWRGRDPAPAVEYSVKRGGMTEIDKGELILTNNHARVDTKCDGPGTLLLEAIWKAKDGSERKSVAGAAVAPNRIPLSAPPPEDFDAFWKAKIKELKAVHANPKVENLDCGNTNLDYCKVTMDNIRGTHIYGQLARPHTGKTFPALLIVQWAGVYPLQKSWVTERAAEGWLTLNIEAHDLPIDNPPDFYHDTFNGALKDYWTIGNDDRDKSYFLRMYLSCYRAVEYLADRPDWDGKTLVVMGGSQGGQQTLMIAGLHPKQITAALAIVPAGCDMLGPNIGRAPGWPHWYQNTEGGKEPTKVHEASRYYDVANFVPHIQCPVLIGVGLQDQTCPPAGIFAAINQMKAPKDIVILPKAGHQEEGNSHAAYMQQCYSVWLPSLRQGKGAPVKSEKRPGI
jgi:cephalosporin-C deacetylase-like acetyl esterase